MDMQENAAIYQKHASSGGLGAVDQECIRISVDMHLKCIILTRKHCITLLLG